MDINMTTADLGVDLGQAYYAVDLGQAYYAEVKWDGFDHPWVNGEELPWLGSWMDWGMCNPANDIDLRYSFNLTIPRFKKLTGRTKQILRDHLKRENLKIKRTTVFCYIKELLEDYYA